MKFALLMILVSVALVVAGVYVLVGLGWALIAAGVAFALLAWLCARGATGG